MKVCLPVQLSQLLDLLGRRDLLPFLCRNGRRVKLVVPIRQGDHIDRSQVWGLLDYQGSIVQLERE